MNMSAWTTKQSKCVYRIHHTQTHKGTKTQVYSNGLVFLSEHCCLPFTCMWTWLRCSTKTCILIPRRALSLHVCVCLRCCWCIVRAYFIERADLVWKSNWIFSSCKHFNQWVWIVVHISLFFFFFWGVLLWSPSSFTCEWKLKAFGGIQVSIERFYLHFVIVNARTVWVSVYDITVAAVPMGKRFYPF